MGCPLPPLGKRGRESLGPDGVEVLADVRQAVVNEVGDLAVELTGDERRKNCPSVCRRSDDDGSPNVRRSGARAGLIGPGAGRHRECSDEEAEMTKSR